MARCNEFRHWPLCLAHIAKARQTHWIGPFGWAIVRPAWNPPTMSQAAEILAASRAPHVRIVGVVSAAHFVSHYYIILLAPLLPFVRADYDVSYTEIGLALAAFNIVSAALQTPAGFLVDWLGARILLVAGLAIGAGAFVIIGFTNSFWLMVAMFALAGVGNTVYHPADYAMLSHHVPADRIGQAFSVHTFAGMLGSAVAPASLLMMQSLWGWRGAFVGAGVLGFAVAALLMAVHDSAEVKPAAQPRDKDETAPVGWRLLLSPAILLNLLFFVLLALISGGSNNFSVVAFGALYGTPVTVANAALTGNLLFSAIGVLIGGLLVGRTTRHGLVAALGLAGMAVFIALVAEFNVGALALIAAMSAAGLCSGIIMPSRDMIVRDVTPPGSFGKVFGFVTTGFNIGGIISPLIFGAIMDHDSPRLVFLAVAAFSLIAILTVMTRPKPQTR
jgi:MFS family permease